MASSKPRPNFVRRKKHAAQRPGAGDRQGEGRARSRGLVGEVIPVADAEGSRVHGTEQDQARRARVRQRLDVVESGGALRRIL